MNISLRGISKSFELPNQNLLRVLKDCNLDVPTGARVAIVGSSGVGKSTLMHIIGLLDPPTSGGVYWDAREVTRLPPVRLAGLRNRGIGFIFQHHYLLSECTALENVLLPALIGGRPRQSCEPAAADLLHMVDLSDRADFYPRQLSGGERQRVALARALMNEPSLILADEVTGNLDASLKDAMMRALVGCADRFCATLIGVTHDFSLLPYYDTVYKLVDGRLDGPQPR